MVCMLTSRSSGSGLSPGQGQSVVFLGKTHNCHSASFPQEYNWVPAILMLGKTLGLSRNIPGRLMLQKLILMGHWADKQACI